MAQLRQDYARFEELGAQVIVVGPDDAGAFARHWEKEELPFVGLPDPKHKVLKLFGQQVKLFRFGRMPAQVIVDKQGMARYVHYGHSMSDIPPNSEVLELLEGLNQEES